MTYTDMKDSGVPWIGNIPAHWRTVRAKFYFRQTNNRGNKTPVLLAASQKYGMCPQSWLDGVVKVAEDTDLQQFKTVHVNDFVISLRSFQGGFEQSSFEGVCSPAYQVFHSIGPYDNHFLRYLFKSEMFIDEMNSLTVGIREGKNIKYEDFANSMLYILPLNEQSGIASYLDKHCAEIDAIISEAQSSIDDYKRWKASVIFQAVTKGLNPDIGMKDSGIPWIGQIPREWKTCAIKRFCVKIGSGKTPSGGAEIYSNSGVIFLRSQNVYNEGLRLSDVSHISQEIDEEMSSTRVQYNDVLLNITGGSMGRCCLFDLHHTQANVNQHVCIIRTIPQKVRPEFLHYFWISESGPMAIAQYQTGGNRPGLNFEQIGRTKIPLCPLEVQDAIIQYLNKRCKVIDALIGEKQSLISELEAYKKSLIYEAVTGKRKVV